jgi:hypothetical protein
MEMSSGLHAHDYLLPRVAALLDDAVAHDIPRDVAVAVLIDLITSSTFDTAAPDPVEDSPPPQPKQRDEASPT